MTYRRRACAALVAAVICGPLAAQPKDSTIEFSNCEVRLPGTSITAELRCGTLAVPEDPARPEGRQIELRVALAPARARTAAPDPVFFLAGGPGQAAAETWPIMRRTLRGIQRDRDIVLVDQRGTGESNPIDCPVPEEDSLETVIDLDAVRDWAAGCLAGLEETDPRFYTTTIAMQDIDRVRAAMGYERINLLGGSYGTRAALVYLRQFPDRVRSIILDSVVPMSLNLGEEHAQSLDRSIRRVFEDCRGDVTCNALYPDLQPRLEALIADLREAPREVDLVNPVDGQPMTLTMTTDMLALAFRMLSYDSQSQGLLPLLLDEATSAPKNGHDPLERVAAQSLMVAANLTEVISRGMEMSVLCSEDFPFMTVDDSAADTLMGRTMLDAISAQCSVWPAGEVPEGFHDPVVSDVPVLLLSGERDPVTPPPYADEVAGHLANSRHLVARGQGHIVIHHVCMRGIAERFLAEGSVADLDTACVDTIEPAPVFTSLLGPNP